MLNTWLSIPSGYLAEGAGHQGFDGVTVDLQHGMNRIRNSHYGVSGGLLHSSRSLGRLRPRRFTMPLKSPFKHHRFPKEIMLCAVRWCLHYPLSYQGVVDLLVERDVVVDRSTVFRWVQKFGPEMALLHKSREGFVL